MDGNVTIRDVAALAGVSPSTVSRVLNGNHRQHMTPATRDRVHAAIDALRYTPLRSARSLRRQRSHVLAVVLPDISNPFFSLLARGVESIAFGTGCSTMICNSDHSPTKERHYLEILLAEQALGVVYIPTSTPDEEGLKRLARSGARIVVADRAVPGFPSVRADNAGGSRALAEYVLRCGYRRIAYLAGPADVSTARERLEGFRAALDAAGVQPVAIEHGPFTCEAGYDLSTKLARSARVDALVAANDMMALGALRAVEDAGLSVPEHVGVAGFDHAPWTTYLRPQLTTVEVPALQIGEVAAGQLLSEVAEDACLPTRLIEGETCVSRR